MASWVSSSGNKDELLRLDKGSWAERCSNIVGLQNRKGSQTLCNLIDNVARKTPAEPARTPVCGHRFSLV